MALQKNIELSSGLTAGYTKIHQVDIQQTYFDEIEMGEVVKKSFKRFAIGVTYYKDADARQNKQPVERTTIHVTGNFWYNHENPLPEMYTLLKATPRFTGATDV